MSAMRSLILALVAAIISETEGSRMSELDCGEGMMRDLDGTCVKKFKLPTTKLECPKLSVDNGEIFLIGEIFVEKINTKHLPTSMWGMKHEPNKENRVCHVGEFSIYITRPLIDFWVTKKIHDCHVFPI